MKIVLKLLKKDSLTGESSENISEIYTEDIACLYSNGGSDITTIFLNNGKSLLTKYKLNELTRILGV
ncbi:MAG TPA: hypothetical protein VI911_11360 [Patescibacteria group bacterium]|nr:hypothetical protein [Patescibacteria group bacterium]